ncbi:MAG: 3,4-dihydroxy-2-butanone-4-phosphate synthase [Phycisphaerales bacterium]|jgi:3,4-dihydroxy 2-butanone 4-phosphate synthase/GTP cyclohydrolase II
MPFSPLPDILADLRAGKMVVLTDDESRENEGDLILPVASVTPERITWMLQHALGYMCLSLTEADCDRLNLHPQGNLNNSARGTAFTVSIDLHPKHGGTTGVSAKERAKCIQMAVDPAFGPDDFVRPGHINPLRSRDGGVLVRTGQTEGSLDLCRLAGLYPAAVIIEIMKPDGEMARVPDLIEFCKTHGLKMCSVAQIIEHRLARESLVRRVEPITGHKLRTPLGEFDALVFQSAVDPLPHVVLSVGGVGLPDPADGTTPAAFRRAVPSSEPTLVRMHRRHLLGDVFGDLDSTPDGASGDVLRASMKMIQAAGRGAIVYLRTSTHHAPAATDLESVLQTLSTPGSPGTTPGTTGPDPNAVPMPQREFGIGGQVLRQLGLTKLRLITSSHRAMPGLEAFGLEITERVPPM